MKNEQRQTWREIIKVAEGHYNHRIGNFEFDHSDRTETQCGTIYLNCVSRDGKVPTVRFKVESINDRGFNLIHNGDIGIDWGARVVLEQSFDSEGNPVNAIIQDNAGVSVACSVVYEGMLAITERDEPQTTPERDKTGIKGYTYTNGEADKYSSCLLTVGNYAYEIHVDRVDFMHHFLDNDVIVEPLIDKQRVRLTAQDGTQTKALIIDCVDAVSPEDADLTEVEADRLFHAMAETTPLLCSQPDQPDAILANDVA